MFAILFVLSTLAVAYASTYGVDVSSLTSQSSFSCMVSNGKKFAVVRVYQSSGHPDSNGPSSIKNAWNGGMKYVDGYIFPCYSCGNPAKQMQDTVNYLSDHNVMMATPGELQSETNSTLSVKYGMLWLDIEGTQYWSSSTSNNVNFLQQMVDEGNKLGVNMGIYSSASQWNPIMGGSTKFSKYPLWYAHYDNSASFSDFSSFGGWTKPSIKQYKGTTSLCSASVDLSFY